MMITKKITVTYHTVEAAEDNYFSNFYDNAETMINTNTKKGTFEAGDLLYQWELLEKIDTDKTPMYMLSCVKERPAWPFLITEEGDRAELQLTGSLGDPYYALFCPAYKFIICAGGAMQFKKLLGQFSPEGVVLFYPVYEDKIDEKVMEWDFFKKVSLSFNMPSGEDVTGFHNTKTGELLKILGFLGGLKLDVTVSSGSGRETLSLMMVKDILPELLANDLCTSVSVKGSDFENAVSQQYDLKNAQIKYNESMGIEGRYMLDSDAKQVLMRALNERANSLFVER